MYELVKRVVAMEPDLVAHSTMSDWLLRKREAHRIPAVVMPVIAQAMLLGVDDLLPVP